MCFMHIYKKKKTNFTTINYALAIHSWRWSWMRLKVLGENKKNEKKKKTTTSLMNSMPTLRSWFENLRGIKIKIDICSDYSTKHTHNQQCVIKTEWSDSSRL